MNTRFNIRQVAIGATTVVVVFLAFLYSYIQRIFSFKNTASKYTVSNQCAPKTPGQGMSQHNPNKMLFISCGGFLE